MSSLAQNIALKNRTGEVQRAFVDGNIEQLLPYQTGNFSPEVAAAFLEQRRGFVSKHVAARIPTPLPNEQIIWIANVTGNPFLPERVTLRRYKKGEEEEYEVDNPLRTPAVIRRKYKGGQRTQQTRLDPYSEESLNLPGDYVELPPYTRAPISVVLGEWMLRRDNQQARHHIGKMIQCRPPAEYEPNEAWSIPRLRFYAAQILDIPQNYLDAITGPDADLSEGEQKIGLLRHMFFRLVDERWNLPSKASFVKIWENRGGNPNRVQTTAERVKAAKGK